MWVSVIVPVYNPGAHLDECVASRLAQTVPADEHELIFIDDGSTDGSGERLDALAAEPPHVVVRAIPSLAPSASASPVASSSTSSSSTRTRSPASCATAC